MLNGLTRPKGTDLQPDDGSKDLFVHISAVERAGLSTLNKGAIVSYEAKENRGKMSAENLRVGLSHRPVPTSE